MAENQPLLRSDDSEVVRESEGTERKSTASARVVSLDVFRGLCVFVRTSFSFLFLRFWNRVCLIMREPI